MHSYDGCGRFQHQRKHFDSMLHMVIYGFTFSSSRATLRENTDNSYSFYASINKLINSIHNEKFRCLRVLITQTSFFSHLRAI